ncbi:MAG: MarR family transcriptional regulator [Humidesulfovibrio sp.]|nr:MarR family transcriptional regulator [Humidesulfovibrio sp.]
MNDAPSHYQLKESLGHLATQFSKAVLRRINQGMQANGFPISSEQWTALVQIWNAEGMTQQQLGEKLLKEKTNVARLLSSLEQSGYIERRPGAADRREKTVHLGPAGRRAMPRLVALVQRILDEAGQGIAEGELAICRRVLLRARLNLASASGE